MQLSHSSRRLGRSCVMRGACAPSWEGQACRCQACPLASMTPCKHRSHKTAWPDFVGFPAKVQPVMAYRRVAACVQLRCPTHITGSSVCVQPSCTDKVASSAISCAGEHTFAGNHDCTSFVSVKNSRAASDCQQLAMQILHNVSLQDRLPWAHDVSLCHT